MDKSKQVQATQALRLAIVEAIKAGLSEGEIKGVAGDVLGGIKHFGIEFVEQFARTGKFPAESEGQHDER